MWAFPRSCKFRSLQSSGVSLMSGMTDFEKVDSELTMVVVESGESLSNMCMM